MNRLSFEPVLFFATNSIVCGAGFDLTTYFFCTKSFVIIREISGNFLYQKKVATNYTNYHEFTFKGSC